MLGLVVGMSDYELLKHTFLSIPFGTALMVIFGYALGTLIAAYKWCLIARSAGIKAKYSSALRANYLGMYANSFGLGLVGGDLTRAVMLVGNAPLKAQSLATVVADRAHGLAVLACIGLIFAFCDGRNLISADLIYLTLAIPLGVLAVWILGPKFILRFVPEGSKLRDKFEQIVSGFPKDPKTILQITLLSVVFHFSQIALHWIMLLGLGLSVPWIYLLSSVPFVNILSSLPISWNGLGVRESAYVFFFTPGLLEKEHAVALGALWLLALTTCSAIGGLVSVLSKTPAEKPQPAHYKPGPSLGSSKSE